jgi:hypothetical protein
MDMLTNEEVEGKISKAERKFQKDKKTIPKWEEWANGWLAIEDGKPLFYPGKYPSMMLFLAMSMNRAALLYFLVRRPKLMRFVLKCKDGSDQQYRLLLALELIAKADKTLGYKALG